MAKKKKSTAKKPQSAFNKDVFMAVLISLVLGLLFGIALGAVATEDNNNSKVVVNDSTKTTHSHSEKYEVESENAPKVELVVSEDAKSGYNIKVLVTDFTFTPESVNGENVLGEGHAHLYVDGVKVARLYSPYFHYSGDFDGSKAFKVTLNANDHSEYSLNGDVIESEVLVTHESHGADGHDDDHTH